MCNIWRHQDVRKILEVIVGLNFGFIFRSFLQSLQKLRKERKGQLRRLQLISTDDWDITDSLEKFQDIMEILEVCVIKTKFEYLEDDIHCLYLRALSLLSKTWMTIQTMKCLNFSQISKEWIPQIHGWKNSVQNFLIANFQTISRLTAKSST